MANPVKPVPEGYHTVTPYLIIKGAAKAIDFYKQAFGAREQFRVDGPDGRIGHAEIRIGDSIVMLSDEHPEIGARGPQSIGGTPVTLALYLENVDRVFQRAVDAGATVLRPVRNQFYGDRSGSVTDPFGHIWHIATHVEDVPPDEMERRAKEAMGGPK